MHLVKAIQGERFQIGNNRGGINGWVCRQIFGRLIATLRSSCRSYAEYTVPIPPCPEWLEELEVTESTRGILAERIACIPLGQVRLRDRGPLVPIMLHVIDSTARAAARAKRSNAVAVKR